MPRTLDNTVLHTPFRERAKSMRAEFLERENLPIRFCDDHDDISNLNSQRFTFLQQFGIDNGHEAEGSFGGPLRRQCDPKGFFWCRGPTPMTADTDPIVI